MNPPAAQILAMTVHRAMGSRIKYRSSHTNRVRTGTIQSILDAGVRVRSESRERMGCGLEFVGWGAISEASFRAGVDAAQDAAILDRLIAAAPDLLAALEDSLYIGCDQSLHEAIRERSRAAIAKAKEGA